jgi:hypothetical protein
MESTCIPEVMDSQTSGLGGFSSSAGLSEFPYYHMTDERNFALNTKLYDW